MDLLAAFLAGASLLWGLVALGLGSMVASATAASRRTAQPPARGPVMLLESDVRGGVRGILP